MSKINERIDKLDQIANDPNMPKTGKVEDFIAFMESKGITISEEDKKSVTEAADSMSDLKEGLIEMAWMEYTKDLEKWEQWTKMSVETRLVCKFFFEKGARKLFYDGIQVGKELTTLIVKKYSSEMEDAQKAAKNN